MPKLVITRKKEWFNRLKPFKVFIDDSDKGLIKNDETVEYELPAGTYKVQCKYNWMSSAEMVVDIKSSGNTYLAVSNGMKLIIPLYIMLMLGLFFPFFLKLAKVPLPASTDIIKIALVFPPLIYILLYLSVFKKKYISIGEDKSNPFS